MKNLNRRATLLFIGLLMFWGVCGHALAAETSPWTFMGFTKYRDALFIDKDRLNRPAPGKVIVSARIEPSAKSLFRRNIKKEIPQYNKSLKNFQYLIMEIEMDCGSHQLRVKKIQFLAEEGRIMHTTANPGAPWKHFKPGSLWKDLENAVCP